MRLVGLANWAKGLKLSKLTKSIPTNAAALPLTGARAAGEKDAREERGKREREKRPHFFAKK